MSAVSVVADGILERMRRDRDHPWFEWMIEDIRDVHEPTTTLSRRELDVLRCASHGLCAPHTADALGVEQSTVKTHLDHARAKLGAKTTTQAACEAIRRGLIP